MNMWRCVSVKAIGRDNALSMCSTPLIPHLDLMLGLWKKDYTIIKRPLLRIL